MAFVNLSVPVNTHVMHIPHELQQLTGKNRHACSMLIKSGFEGMSHLRMLKGYFLNIYFLYPVGIFSHLKPNTCVHFLAYKFPYQQECTFV